jgi:acyl-CoA thioesterase-1
MDVLAEDRWIGHTTRPYILGQTPASYGRKPVPIQSLRLAAILATFAFAGGAAAEPVKLVVLGDSLAAGYGLPAAAALPARLEAALKAHGHDVVVVNAGVSGDTSTDGLARADWSVGADADAVVVELGGNDALRGIDPKVTRQALGALLDKLTERRLPVLLAGMVAPPNLGSDYATAFNPIYADLAKEHGVQFYPFILGGVVGRPDLIQADGIHPNAAGVDVIVARMLPSVESLLGEVGTPP